MRAGRKNHLIHLLKPIETQQAGGEKIISYEKQYECFAGFEDVRNVEEKRQYQQDQDIIKGVKRIPFDDYPDFTGEWRILDVELNQEYEVLSYERLRNRQIIAIARTLKTI